MSWLQKRRPRRAFTFRGRRRIKREQHSDLPIYLDSEYPGLLPQGRGEVLSRGEHQLLEALHANSSHCLATRPRPAGFSATKLGGCMVSALHTPLLKLVLDAVRNQAEHLRQELRASQVTAKTAEGSTSSKRNDRTSKWASISLKLGCSPEPPKVWEQGAEVGAETASPAVSRQASRSGA